MALSGSYVDTNAILPFVFQTLKTNIDHALHLPA